MSKVLNTRVLGIAARTVNTTVTSIVRKMSPVKIQPKSTPAAAKAMKNMNDRTPNPQRTAVSLIITSTKFLRTIPALLLMALVALSSSATIAGIVK